MVHRRVLSILMSISLCNRQRRPTNSRWQWLFKTVLRDEQARPLSRALICGRGQKSWLHEWGDEQNGGRLAKGSPSRRQRRRLSRMAHRFSSLNRRVPESGEGLSLRRFPSARAAPEAPRLRSISSVSNGPALSCALRFPLVPRLPQCICRRSSSLPLASAEMRG